MLEKPKRILAGFFLVAGCALQVHGPALAADAVHGQAIAERWCTGCHLVRPDQTTPVTDKAPSFASLAKRPDFNAARLALLLLAPHPNMPNLVFSQQEVADLADYILTLK
jgi:mono/diheme cytochrome c family protein